MQYELKLVTNMTTELKTQLTTITELSVANALETHLKNIFSDFAHDVNLSFYDTETTKERLEHRVDIINTNQTTYDLTLPMRKYLHLAVANIAENKVVGLAKDNYSYSSMLEQAEGTVPDGSSIEIQQVGDEFYHYMINRAGKEVREINGMYVEVGEAPTPAVAQARRAKGVARRQPSQATTPTDARRTHTL